MQETGTYSDERIMSRSDGALFWCHVAGRALDRADPFAHAVWMFEDISLRRPVGAALTIREREIAQHIVTGATSKQIARLLDISHRTVEAHRARLMRKLGASTTGRAGRSVAGPDRLTRPQPGACVYFIKRPVRPITVTSTYREPTRLSGE